MRGILIRALVEMGDTKSALEQLPLRYSDVPMLSDAGVVYARAGKREDALRQLERLERRRAEGYGMSYEIATSTPRSGRSTRHARRCDALPTIIRRRLGGCGRIRGWIRCAAIRKFASG